MSETESALLEKIRKLPAKKVGEVEDFVDFLLEREHDLSSARIASRLAEDSFARVWDNAEDAIYDEPSIR